jgi:diguanylate cyclase (GGDEF)-like protein
MPGASNHADLALTAERIIHHIEQPIRVGRSTAHVSASIGIAVSATGSTTFDALFREADAAMYAAKAAGRARFQIHA